MEVRPSGHFSMLRESPYPLTPVDRALRQVLDCAAPLGAEEKTIWDERVRRERPRAETSLCTDMLPPRAHSSVVKCVPRLSSTKCGRLARGRP